MPMIIVIVLTLGLQAPAGWDATYLRVQQLVLDRKTTEAIAILEGVLKSSPGFDPARYELADVHRTLAMEAALQEPPQDATRRRELELAAAGYRRVAEGTSEYKQLALGNLLRVYSEDELNRPAEVIPLARQYIQIDPASFIGHATLVKALTATGQEPAATAALLAARTAIRADDGQLLVTVIVDYLLKATTSSTGDLKTLVDWADGTLDRSLRTDPDNRNLLLTKAALASYRADRLETDPARKRVLKAEADRAFERFRAANPNRGTAPSSTAAPAIAPPAPPPPPPPPAMPPGWEKAMGQYGKLLDEKRYTAAAAVWEEFIKSNPGFAPPHYFRAEALLLGGQRPAFVAALKTARASIATSPEARHTAGTFILDMVSTNTTIAAADAKLLLGEARSLLDEALQKKPDYWEALVYKSLVVRTQAKYETDPAIVQKLTAEADRLRAQAEAMRPK